jgi:Mrp family chromosome partitioning ATPase
MESLLEQAKAEYDLVVVDTPPLTAASDAFPLLSKVDGVIIVGRVGRNRRDVAERMHETLTGAGAPLLGVVANGLKSGRRGGYGSNRGRLRSSQKSFRWAGRVKVSDGAHVSATAPGARPLRSADPPADTAAAQRLYEKNGAQVGNCGRRS